MISKTTKDFQNEVLNNMTFKPYKTENYTIYKNENKPELGYFIKYSREHGHHLLSVENTL